MGNEVVTDADKVKAAKIISDLECDLTEREAIEVVAAALVAERESAAKKCDAIVEKYRPNSGMAVAEECAHAIRQGDKQKWLNMESGFRQRGCYFPSLALRMPQQYRERSGM